jgi:hypothetical protein
MGGGFYFHPGDADLAVGIRPKKATWPARPERFILR